MAQNVETRENKIYKLVLTGGPCGGKTTGQSRLCTFFENLGWKVYRVPEAATVLLGGGVKWSELSGEDAYNFQENLLKTMIHMENTFFQLAETCKKNCIVICDRGTMDASAFLQPELWNKMKEANKWNNVDIRDNRYNQIVHMVSAAIGAEEFYTIEDHVVRSESVDQAKELDQKASRAWVGHPYFDVIDNSSDFANKLQRMISVVCHRIGIETGDRLALDSRKRKFLIAELPKNEQLFPPFEDFEVVHDYLVSPTKNMQARLRRRGQGSAWTYTHTIRRPEINNQRVETKMQITRREYQYLLSQRDDSHYRVFKKRRCFVWKDQYFQMDIYQNPCHPRCKGLILLETFTTKGDGLELPNFLNVLKEVTFDMTYSMFNLSLMDDFTNDKLVKILSVNK